MEHASKRESRYRYDPDYAPAGGGAGGGGKRRPRNRLSCAECRRLKLKCDRVWPCSSCTKRGCARICPDGTLQAKIRSKDTSVLLAKISELEKLVLEKDRLIAAAASGELNPAELQRQQASLRPHHDDPAAAGSSDFMPAGMFASDAPGGNAFGGEANMHAEEEDPVHSLLDGIGTLNMSGDGRSRYLGLSAGSAYIDADDSDASEGSTPGTSEGPDPFARSPESVASAYGHSPGDSVHSHVAAAAAAAGGSKVVDVSQLKSVLPARQEAGRLGGIYYSLVSFIYEPCTQDGFNEIVEEAYGDRRDAMCPTRLALLYMIFALSVLFDPALPAMSPESQKWYDAAERCLNATDYLSSPTMAAVQTLHLMGTFLLNSRVDAEETFWPRLGIAMRLAQAMGLHRDGSNWGLEQPELDQRRRTFHELLSHDRLQALMLGRPYSISDKHFDTTLPESEELGQQRAAELVAAGEASASDEERAAGFHIAKWRLSAVVGKVVDEAFSVLPPSYATIQRLDAEIRMFDQGLPDALRCSAVPNMQPVSIFAKHEPFSSRTTPNLKLTLQQHTLAVFGNHLLLFLHRRAFAQALSDAAEPMQTPYAPSVITVILEAGKHLISIAKSAQDIYELSNRWWHLFLHAYGGAACMASLLIKTPACVLAQNAWEQLGLAITVFETAAQHGPLARDLLTRLTKLQRQAMVSLSAHQQGLPPPKHRRLSSTVSQAVRPFSLTRHHHRNASRDEGATPMATGASAMVDHYAESSADEGNELPPELGASTRLTRRNRRRAASISTSSAASGRVHSVSSSRSRGTSFTSSSSASDFDGVSSGFRGSWSLGSDDVVDTSSWQNLSVEPNAALSPVFGPSAAVAVQASQLQQLQQKSQQQAQQQQQQPQQPQPAVLPGPVGAQSFAAFSDAFHPPMLPPPSIAMMSGNAPALSNPAYGPPPMFPPGASDSPRLYPLPPSVTGSPPLGPLGGAAMSRNASAMLPPPLTLKPGHQQQQQMLAAGVGGSAMQGVQGTGGAGDGHDPVLSSPMNPHFDLLDTFLTWHAYEQPYDPTAQQ